MPLSNLKISYIVDRDGYYHIVCLGVNDKRKAGPKRTQPTGRKPGWLVRRRTDEKTYLLLLEDNATSLPRMPSSKRY
jgi:hypothetical protein